MPLGGAAAASTDGDADGDIDILLAGRAGLGRAAVSIGPARLHVARPDAALDWRIAAR